MTSSTPMHTGPRGLDQLMRLGAARPLEPGCDRFYFLRHGQTERNARRIFQTPAEPLNATGMAQARRAAGLLAGEPIATIVCSDILRAHDTAIEIASRHSLVPVPHIGLRERNFGALIGTFISRWWSHDPSVVANIPMAIIGSLILLGAYRVLFGGRRSEK